MTSSPLDGENETTPEKNTGGGASDRKLKIIELMINAASGIGVPVVLWVLDHKH